MSLTEEQVVHYREQGYLLLDDVFIVDEVQQIRAHAQADLCQESERRVCEADGGLARAVHGSHLVSKFFSDLVRLPRLLSIARQVLGGDVYVHQFKINAKAALKGEPWEWHQDAYFWHHEDGMPDALAINVAIHLDEANEFNGPLLMIPQSHLVGEMPAVAVPQRDEESANPPNQSRQGSQDWRRTVSAKLKYTLEPAMLAEMVSKQGIVSAKGPAGSVLLFDPSILHGSSGNVSPFDRCILFISYNRTSNRLGSVERPRPEFLASRNFTPLTPLEQDALWAEAVS